MQNSIVWKSTLDNRYECIVTRMDAGRGHLLILDTETNANLHLQEVVLSYGAAYGPDVDDVAFWQEICAKVVDGTSEV